MSTARMVIDADIVEIFAGASYGAYRIQPHNATGATS